MHIGQNATYDVLKTLPTEDKKHNPLIYHTTYWSFVCVCTCVASIYFMSIAKYQFPEESNH